MEINKPELRLAHTYHILVTLRSFRSSVLYAKLKYIAHN